jgi:hypothetical protein
VLVSDVCLRLATVSSRTENDATLRESPLNNKSSPMKKSKKASKKKEGRPKLSIFGQSSSEVSGTKRNTASHHVSFDQDPFPIFRYRAYLRKGIPVTRRVH